MGLRLSHAAQRYRVVWRGRRARSSLRRRGPGGAAHSDEPDENGHDGSRRAGGEQAAGQGLQSATASPAHRARGSTPVVPPWHGNTIRHGRLRRRRQPLPGTSAAEYWLPAPICPRAEASLAGGNKLSSRRSVAHAVSCATSSTKLGTHDPGATITTASAPAPVHKASRCQLKDRKRPTRF